MPGVERWAPTFTKYFTDEQILNPHYAISIFYDGRYCKLCGSGSALPPGESSEEHLGMHAEELRAWRARQAQEAAARKRVSAEEREQKSEITSRQRLKNRITSSRHRLNHPEKYGKGWKTRRAREWSDEEKAALHKNLDAAIAALKEYDEKEAP